MPLFYVVLRMAYVSLWVQVLLEYVATDFLKYAKAPGPFGDRRCTPSWLHGADGGVCRLLYAVHPTFSLGPCTAMVH